MEVRTDLRFAGPGRLQITHQLRSTSGTLTPWQRRLADSLGHQGFRSRELGATTLLTTAVLPLDDARAALVATLQAAEALGAGPLPGPSLILEERNWLLGVRQRLLLELDLRQLGSLPGLELSVGLQPVRLQSVVRSEPDRVKSGAGAGVIWPLRAGCWNRIELRCWRWNPLGIGAAAIALVLPLVLVLQRLRVQLGLGLPELPA